MALFSSNADQKPKTQDIAKPVVPAMAQSSAARVYTRDQHPISRKDISPNALKVLYRLKDRGYDAYLVGGCIRDLLLGLHPKDFDVVTNATPEEVKRCFNNCRLVGRRFRLAHVMFGREIIEVATFRGHHDDEQNQDQKTAQQSHEGQLLRDNVYGNIEEDAERRDFTVNALYYSIKDFAIHDFANGMQSIEQGNIDLIGDPQTRYREDPVRMLRAVRFATKLQMSIAARSKEPLYSLGHLLRNIPPARLFDESLKLFLAGHALQNYLLLREFGLFRHYFPVADEVLSGREESKERVLIERMLEQTDERINQDKSVSPAFIFAAMLWYPLERHAKELELESGLHPYDAFQLAMNDVLHRAVQTVAIPKRFTSIMREIWQMQHRLHKIQGKAPERMIEQGRFRAAYDFLVLRADAEGGELAKLAHWWTEYQQSDPQAQQAMASNSKPRNTRKAPANKRPRRRKPSKPKSSDV